MHNLYASIRFALLAIFCLSFVQRSHAVQLQYVTAVVAAKNVTNAAHAIDNSATTAATLTASTLLGGANLRMSFGSSVPAGGMAGLVIQAGSNLDLSLLSGMTIRTYMGSNVTYEENMPVGSLVNLSLLSSNGGKATVEFPVSKPFNQVELRIAGLLNASFDVDVYSAYGTVAAPLPVELAAFQGKSTAGGNALAWSTASERNSDYFVVERADTSPENFRSIGKVQSAGTTTHRTEYTFVDAYPAALSYYRLRQVDRDGTTSFSPVVTVKKAAASESLAVYPNPATEAVAVAAAPGTRFALFDQLGRQLQAGEIQAGANPTLDVRALPGGVYFVRDLNTGNSIRFVKAAALE
ncbi:T9SS type A sorting domain-containing protein [Hymenobacter sp. DH14]|uniref:T9SS type A sorting domain-containing protein n=1 Tax=Hymenobacter cyanobacteriorum TaxID=2926463 RepID=A0A9X1VD15_9BACT|nr:T9SS type A sorting domain-containing protein [Hymenobacter cyanobacteriorum]MCI1186315.1 T9SS type A sorting domain-containing protein [Hymenobacter cyanobacteriorum]